MIFPIFIMHYKKNYKRKLLLNNILKKELKEDNPVVWVEEYDRDEVSYSLFYEQFAANQENHFARQPNEFKGRYPLQPEVVSLCLKHKSAIENFLKNFNNNFCLFLEDDAILHENFFEKLKKYITELPEDWDAAFLGQGCNKHIDQNLISEDKYWYKKDYPADRNTDSILFNRIFLDKLLKYLNHHKMCFPIDHEYSFWFHHLNANVYWLEPSIVTQGSQLGIFQTFQPANSTYLNENMKSRSDLLDLLNHKDS